MTTEGAAAPRGRQRGIPCTRGVLWRLSTLLGSLAIHEQHRCHNLRMPVPPHSLPGTLGNTFAVAAARGAGVSRGRLRARDLDAPFHGVRQLLVPADDVEDHTPLARDRAVIARVRRAAEAYASVMPPHAFFVGRTAAALLERPVDESTELEVAVSGSARAVRAAGVRGRKVAPHLVMVGRVHGLPVSSPAATWAMLAEDLDVRGLVLLGDGLVRIPRGPGGIPQPHRQLAAVADLHHAAHARRRRGRPELLQALEHIRVGSMSTLESDFRLVSTAAGLPEPELDVEIFDTSARLIGIADAVYVRDRVIVEVEGDHHRTDRRQWQRDLRKHAEYLTAGWRPLRLTSADIRGRVPRAPQLVAAALRSGPIAR